MNEQFPEQKPDLSKETKTKPQHKPMPQQDQEDEWIKETFSCNICRNGGIPCPIHSNPVDISVIEEYFKQSSQDKKEEKDEDEINNELRDAAQKKRRTDDFANDEERTAYMKSLFPFLKDEDEQKAS